MKIMKNKKSIRVMVFTLLLLSAIYFISFPSTLSKYIKARYVDTNPALTYNVNIRTIGGKIEKPQLQTSTDTKMKYYFEFNRQDSMITSDIKDTYKVELNNGCSIDSVFVNNKEYSLTQGNLIEFTSPGTEKIKVNVSCVTADIKTNSCPTTNATECFASNIMVKEYFNDNTEKTYDYGKNSLEISVDEYQDLFGKDPTDIYSEDYRTYIMNKDRADKTDGITTWLNYVSAYYGYEQGDAVLLANYITSSFTEVNGTTLTDDNLLLINNIDGITAKKNADGNYEFFLEDYFTSYAKTYRKRAYRQYYFHNIDGTDISKENVDNLFLYYMDKYSAESEGLYDKDSDEYKFIKDYLASEERDGETVLDLAQRLRIGLTYDPDEKYLIISEKFYDDIRGIIPSITIPKSYSFNRRYTTLVNNLKDTVLKQELITLITASSPASRVVEILKDTTATDINEYVYFDSEDDSVMVHVYFDDTSIHVDFHIISPIELIKTIEGRRKLTTLSNTLLKAGISEELVNKIKSSDANNKVYEYLQITNEDQMFDDYAYFTDGDKNVEVHIYSNDTASTYVGVKFIDSPTAN